MNKSFSNLPEILRIMACLVLPFLGPPSSAYAETVKIKSQLCGNSVKKLFGSGAIVASREHGTILITSSHVIFHGDKSESICHFYFDNFTNDWSPLSAPKINSALGVAVFTIKNEGDSPKIKAYKIGDSAKLRANEAGIIEGSPFSVSTVRSSQGNILATDSKRIYLPLVKTAIEVQGAHNEYGMSGGSLLGKDRSSYLGMLSHQYLRISTGGPARVESIEGESIKNPAETAFIALVIPVNDIMEWLNSWRDMKSEFREDLAEQLSGVLSITFGSVQFRSVNCGGTGGIGGHGVGIGGYGDGDEGGHGIGVGGGEGESPQQRTCEIAIKRAEPALQNIRTWPFKKRSDWFSKIDSKLDRTTSLQFSTLHLEESIIPVRGLYQALSLIDRGYFVRLKGSSSNIHSTQLLESNQKLSEALQRIKSLYGSEYPNPEVPLLIQELSIFSDAIIDSDFDFINIKRIRNVLKVDHSAPYSLGWRALWTDLFDDSLEVVQLTTSLCEILEHIL